jgi:hypothetical protein
VALAVAYTGLSLCAGPSPTAAMLLAMQLLLLQAGQDESYNVMLRYMKKGLGDGGPLDTGYKGHPSAPTQSGMPACHHVHGQCCHLPQLPVGCWLLKCRCPQATPKFTVTTSHHTSDCLLLSISQPISCLQFCPPSSDPWLACHPVPLQ